MSDTNLLDLSFSYNRENIKDSLGETLNGTHDYDQDFMDKYKPGATSYTLSDFNLVTSDENMLVESYQGKATWDWEFLKGQILSFGVESVVDMTNEQNDQLFWTDIASGVGLPGLHTGPFPSRQSGQQAAGIGGLWNLQIRPLLGLSHGRSRDPSRL